LCQNNQAARAVQADSLDGLAAVRVHFREEVLVLIPRAILLPDVLRQTCAQQEKCRATEQSRREAFGSLWTDFADSGQACRQVEMDIILLKTPAI
jgi:hypothetical protein